MSTVRYCNISECRNSSDTTNDIYTIPVDIAKWLKNKGYLLLTYDQHICRHCIEEYINESEEILRIVTNEYLFDRVELGKDFNNG